MKPVQELLDKQEVLFVRNGESVLEVARRMTEWNVGAVTVLDGQRLVGIFSERDLMTRVVSKVLSPATTPVELVMTPHPVVVDSHSTAGSGP